jgi:sulfide:quinone oxidoreductase
MPGTLILGGGFGGIAVATELRRLLGDEHDVVLVDREERFSMGLRKLWELVGHATIADGSRSRDLLAARGVRVVQGEVRAIDPTARTAIVDGTTLAGDQVVIALGAVGRPDLVEGLAEHGHDVWSAAEVPEAARALATFAGGRILVLVAGVPYPCPPAPYECALLVDEHLRERGVRDATELSVATVQPMLLPVAGGEGSEWMAAQLASRDIGFHVGAKLLRVEPDRVVLEDGELEFDLLLAVPPHRVPDVVRESGLAGDSGWIGVDSGTLATEHRGVYAVGDVTQIPLANGLPLPKAGIAAEREGQRVAAAIAAAIRGEPAPPPFDGRAWCYVETGTTTAGKIEAEFFAEPAPRVSLAQPSTTTADEKRRFESERLERWFGG